MLLIEDTELAIVGKSIALDLGKRNTSDQVTDAQEIALRQLLLAFRYPLSTVNLGYFKFLTRRLLSRGNNLVLRCRVRGQVYVLVLRILVRRRIRKQLDQRLADDTQIRRAERHIAVVPHRRRPVLHIDNCAPLDAPVKEQASDDCRPCQAGVRLNAFDELALAPK
jgi:hypothetical protein